MGCDTLLVVGVGSGVPYAMATKFTYPDRVAIALVGDG
jgi:thiamine pyrophosphate-dependent acetolactate synthase large subunit-like protein